MATCIASAAGQAKGLQNSSPTELPAWTLLLHLSQQTPCLPMAALPGFHPTARCAIELLYTDSPPCPCPPAGELNFVLIGVILQLVSICTESTRLTLVQLLLQSRGLKLNPVTTM